jgi:hypothetical protein
MMLAADRIAVIVLAANPKLRDALIENTSGFRKSGSGRMAQPKRRKRKRPLDWGEQMARR